MLRRLAALAVGIFFREVKAVGAERIPSSGPLLVVANHVNSLVDPVLLLARLPRAPRFLAKSTLWSNPFVRPFLELARAVPVYRRQDGVDTRRNLNTFARCCELLAESGVVALFPEGVSHDQPNLQPLRTGIARIALEAEQRHSPLGLRIVPVGLVFDDKETFRSRALVLVGEPVDPLAGVERAGPTPAAVELVTQRVAAALREVTPSYSSWQQARLIERAVTLAARPAADDTRRVDLAEAFPLQQAFRKGLDDLAARQPQLVQELSAEVARYDRLLTVAGLRDEQVAATYPRSVVVAYLARTLSVLLAWLPLAVVGTALSWPPYRLIGAIARRAPSKDTRATYKLLSAVLLLPTVWCLEAAAALWLVGPWAALATLVGAPLASLAALSFHERRLELGAEARAFLLLGSRRRAVTELIARRRRLVEKVQELVENYQAAPGGAG